MKFKYTSVTIIIMLLGGFSLSYGSDSDYPIPRKIDIEFDNFRGDCTSCSENYDPLVLGAACCDQASAASEFYTCTVLGGEFTPGSPQASNRGAVFGGDFTPGSPRAPNPAVRTASSGPGVL